MTIKELLENYNELNESVENKFKSITSKIKNIAIASMIGLPLLLSGCSQDQKDAVSRAYDNTKKEASKAYNSSKKLLGNTYNTTKKGILNAVDELDVPGKISNLGDKIDEIDEVSGDWIKEKYGDKFEKEMKDLSIFQQAIIKAKLLAYAGELELTQYDSFETKKAIMFVNYWRKLIKQAKDNKLEESILNEEPDKLLLAYWDREPNWWGWGQRNAAKRAVSVLEFLNKVYSGHFEKMPDDAKANISEALAICKDCRADEYKKYKKIFAGLKLPKPIKKYDPNPHF